MPTLEYRCDWSRRALAAAGATALSEVDTYPHHSDGQSQISYIVHTCRCTETAERTARSRGREPRWGDREVVGTGQENHQTSDNRTSRASNDNGPSSHANVTAVVQYSCGRGQRAGAVGRAGRRPVTVAAHCQLFQRVPAGRRQIPRFRHYCNWLHSGKVQPPLSSVGLSQPQNGALYGAGRAGPARRHAVLRAEFGAAAPPATAAD